LTIPPCADRLEVEGEHERVGRRLVFDHSFDLPFSRTEVSLKRDGHEETIQIWNNQPDGGRILVGAVAGIFGAVLWASAAYEVGLNGGAVTDEGVWYSGVFGTAAIAVGALLSLTGWHPRAPSDIDEFCHEGATPDRQ
jgi:hypothetical protein